MIFVKKEKGGLIRRRFSRWTHPQIDTASHCSRLSCQDDLLGEKPSKLKKGTRQPAATSPTYPPRVASAVDVGRNHTVVFFTQYRRIHTLHVLFRPARLFSPRMRCASCAVITSRPWHQSRRFLPSPFRHIFSFSFISSLLSSNTTSIFCVGTAATHSRRGGSCTG